MPSLLLPWLTLVCSWSSPIVHLLQAQSSYHGYLHYLLPSFGQVRIKSILGDNGVGDFGEQDRKLTALLAVEGARTSLLGLYAAIFMPTALEIKFELVSLMQEKTGERGGTRHSHSSSRGSSTSFPPRLRFMQQRRVSTVPTFSIKRMGAEGAWMPAVGNVATIMCFAICLILNVSLTGGSNQAIFFLAPILLLLNQDSDFVAGFGDKQRYFPVTVAISGYLVLSTLYSIWEDVWHGNSGWGVEVGGPDWLYAVKNLAGLILTFPSHIISNQFVWSYNKHRLGATADIAS